MVFLLRYINSSVPCWRADKKPRGFCVLQKGGKRFFFFLLSGEGRERERHRGPLVEGGSISGRISKCKQTAAHS